VCGWTFKAFQKEKGKTNQASDRLQAIMGSSTRLAAQASKILTHATQGRHHFSITQSLRQAFPSSVIQLWA